MQEDTPFFYVAEIRILSGCRAIQTIFLASWIQMGDAAKKGSSPQPANMLGKTINYRDVNSKRMEI